MITHTFQRSTRLNLESTIEKNIDNINQAVIEKGQSVDPTFHKLSKAFDEGGAKGMLMNNMVRLFMNISYIYKFIVCYCYCSTSDIIKTDCIHYVH